MIYTTVTWNPKPPAEIGNILHAKADELLNGEPSVTNYDQHQDGVTAQRGWPDLATAEAWIEFVQQYNPVSAVINPES
jgi:hypothetical protein